MPQHPFPGPLPPHALLQRTVTAVGRGQKIRFYLMGSLVPGGTLRLGASTGAASARGTELRSPGELG